MAKKLSIALLDAPLDAFAASVNVTLCSAEPANFAGIAAVRLAATTHTPGAGNGSYTKANGDVSGRKLLIAARSGVSITASGVCNHVAYDDGTTLLGVTTCAAQTLVAGGTTTIGSHKLEVREPT